MFIFGCTSLVLHFNETKAQKWGDHYVFSTLAIFNWFWHHKMVLFYSGGGAGSVFRGCWGFQEGSWFKKHAAIETCTLEQGTEPQSGWLCQAAYLFFVPSPIKSMCVCVFVCMSRKLHVRVCVLNKQVFLPEKGNPTKLGHFTHWLILVSFPSFSWKVKPKERSWFQEL